MPNRQYVRPAAILRPQPVRSAHANERGAEHLRMLRDRAANRDAARAFPDTGEARRRGVFVFEQILGAGHEVIDRILFGQLLPGPVPVFAKFPAAADMRDRINASAFQKGEQGGAKGGIARGSVSP